jgi:hypothetical protein
LVVVIKIMKTSAISHSGTLDPVLHDLRARDRLEADDDDPEVPVQPADREAGPVTERVARVIGKRSGRRVGHRHFGQHAHDHDDQDACHGIREESARAGIRNHDARSDEQPGPDHAADRDHPQLTLIESFLQCWCRGRDIFRGSLHGQ